MLIYKVRHDRADGTDGCGWAVYQREAPTGNDLIDDFPYEDLIGLFPSEEYAELFVRALRLADAGAPIANAD